MAQEGTTSGNDELSEWLKHFGLSKYEAGLREAGLEEFGLVKSLDKEDMNDMTEEAKMKKLHKKAFVKAVNAVQHGEYPKETASKPSPNTDEFKEGIDAELMELREGRKDLKGYVERKPDAKNDADGKQTRNIIFIGQTGAGKTTLINSMCSFLHRVSYNEPFRYQLICEQNDDKISKDSTKSQTQDITMYHLRELPAINHALNVIDTPGFGDTEGPEQDKKIRTKFKNFFEKIPFIDAIYFVVKSSDTRLGATQKYIFNMVLDLFGKDVEKNIFILFTFSDGAVPPALEAVKKLEVPYAGYFQINNSGFGLLGPNEQNMTHEMFFNLGVKQFEDIFKHLSEVQTVSTSLTVQTLKERDNITNWLFEIGIDVNEALDKISNAKVTYGYLEANKQKMDANEDFKVPDIEVITHRDPVRNYTTFCSICVDTCHTNCKIPNDGDKSYCWAMTDGYCRQCKGKCEWHKHVNKPFVIRRETKKVWRTKQEMFDKFKFAKDESAKCADLMGRLMDDIEAREKKISDTIIKMKDSVNRLKEIALNKNVLTDDEYFDTLIENEKAAPQKPGWEERVNQLRSMKRENKLLKDVYEEDKAPMSWKQDEDLKKYQQQFAKEKKEKEAKAKAKEEDQGGIQIHIPLTNKSVTIKVNDQKKKNDTNV